MKIQCCFSYTERYPKLDNINLKLDAKYLEIIEFIQDFVTVCFLRIVTFCILFLEASEEIILVSKGFLKSAI